jgi:hypothetical protein
VVDVGRRAGRALAGRLGVGEHGDGLGEAVVLPAAEVADGLDAERCFVVVFSFLVRVVSLVCLFRFGWL